MTIRAYGVLASILDDAVYDERISTNPAGKGKVTLPKKVKRRHGYLTHDEAHRLADASGKYRLLVLVLAYPGIRWGEVTALRVEDVDVARRRIHTSRNAVQVHGEIHVGTPTSHSSRVVPVPEFVLNELRPTLAGRQRDALVFPGPTGSFMRRTRSSDGPKSWFKTALPVAELPLMTVHDLRHTAASLAVQSGANVKTIQRMLGRTSAAMTLDVYSDLFDDDLDDVATALDRATRRTRERP